MRELCQTHKLAIAPDGKCVLCRRPSLRLFTVREEHETIISRIFTALLGVSLAAAGSALIYVSLLDAGYTGGRYVAGPAPIAKLAAEPPAPTPASVPAGDEPNDDAAKPERKETAGRAQAKTAKSAVPATPDATAAKTASPAHALPPTPVQVAVTMYATPWCDICDRAREFLLARDVVLTEHDIDSDRGAERRLAKLNPNVSVPTFEVAGRTFVGFNPWDLEDAVRAARTAESATARVAPKRAP